jgi:hypothetical protein
MAVTVIYIFQVLVEFLTVNWKLARLLTAALQGACVMEINATVTYIPLYFAAILAIVYSTVVPMPGSDKTTFAEGGKSN